LFRVNSRGKNLFGYSQNGKLEGVIAVLNLEGMLAREKLKDFQKRAEQHRLWKLSRKKRK